ncbi:hypothetical protein [Empedobacter brevis]|uniref:hypothetical protein n=1 Tax=Empedobacter brevis TaxID=247 RepID=UPI0028D5A15B|nr:hypothetical protein [Empedobacter brevis]
MATTTDFNEFLDNIFDLNFDEVNDLYLTISTNTNHGIYEYSEKDDNKIFIKNNSNNLTLFLASKKAYESFLNLLNENWGGDFKNVVTNWEFNRINNKD